jgi:hypothetical protein
MDETMHSYDVLHLADLLERVWQERSIAASLVERQSWDVVEGMVLHATSITALESKLRTCIKFAAKGGYRRVLRLALTHMEETILNISACVGV